MAVSCEIKLMKQCLGELNTLTTPIVNIALTLRRGYAEPFQQHAGNLLSLLQAYGEANEVKSLQEKYYQVLRQAQVFDQLRKPSFISTQEKNIVERKEYVEAEILLTRNIDEFRCRSEDIVSKIEKGELKVKKPADTGQKIRAGKKPKAEAWKQIAIEVVDNDTIKYKIGNGNWVRANYTQLGFLDRRKNQANKLWPIYLGLASKNLPSNINRPKMLPKDIDRIRSTLRGFFNIKGLPIEYDRRAKEYHCKFKFNDPRNWTGIPPYENVSD